MPDCAAIAAGPRYARDRAGADPGGGAPYLAFLDAVIEAERIGEPGSMVASQRRDAVFRRSLAVADCLALLFGLTVVVRVTPALQLRPAALAALPPVVLAAKLMGLYDRDETLLRKTTLEEMPKLFHLATLSSLAVLPEADRLFDRPVAYEVSQFAPIARVLADPTLLAVPASAP